MDQKTLERALARHHLQQKKAKPVAKATYEALRAGTEIPEIPESSPELPPYYPYSALPDREARQLAFVTAALPDKAADLQGLWLSR